MACRFVVASIRRIFRVASAADVNTWGFVLHKDYMISSDHFDAAWIRTLRWPFRLVPSRVASTMIFLRLQFDLSTKAIGVFLGSAKIWLDICAWNSFYSLRSIAKTERTKHMAIAVSSGMAKQTNANVRHGINVLRAVVTNMPMVWQMIV